MVLHSCTKSDAELFEAAQHWQPVPVCFARSCSAAATREVTESASQQHAEILLGASQELVLRLTHAPADQALGGVNPWLVHHVPFHDRQQI